MSRLARRVLGPEDSVQKVVESIITLTKEMRRDWEEMCRDRSPSHSTGVSGTNQRV